MAVDNKTENTSIFFYVFIGVIGLGFLSLLGLIVSLIM